MEPAFTIYGPDLDESDRARGVLEVAGGDHFDGMELVVPEQGEPTPTRDAWPLRAARTGRTRRGVGSADIAADRSWRPELRSARTEDAADRSG